MTQEHFKLQTGNQAINEEVVRELFQQFDDLQENWPWQTAVADWVDHLLSFTAKPHVMSAFLEPQGQGGGQLSLRVDGRVVPGPCFTSNQYDQLHAALEARVVFSQTQGNAFLKEGFLLTEAGQRHWAGFLQTVSGVQITLVFEYASLTKEPLEGWPHQAKTVVEQMLKHPNGLIVCCHRGWSLAQNSTIVDVLNSLLSQWKHEIRVGCIVESLQALPPHDHLTQLLVDGSQQSWEQACRALIAQDIDVVYIRGRHEKEAITQAVLTALEDRFVLADVSQFKVVDVLMWLVTELPVSPIQVASVLLGVVGSYRGLRQVCPHCGVEQEPGDGEELLSLLEPQERASIAEGKWIQGEGCTECLGLGYLPQLRLTVAEAIYIDKLLAELCASSPTKSQLSSALQERGFQSYFQQAFEFAQQGVTTLHEAIRVGLARISEL